jgi:hypothetical protein
MENNLLSLNFNFGIKDYLSFRKIENLGQLCLSSNGYISEIIPIHYCKPSKDFYLYVPYSYKI